MSDDASSSNFAPLPLLLYAKPSARLELFAKKMRFCCQQCNFSDPGADLKKKELKRIYLNECVEFVKERRGILIEPIYAMTFALFAHNVFRNLPPHTRLYDPDEDEMIPCPSWPHLQLVYAFFIRVLESPDFQPSKAKRFLDHNFVAKLIDMFASDDENERDSLKTTLHRIYAKFLGLRSFIRKEINNKCLELIYENLYFPGITEILEVLGSVINGFACPIKPEHIQFLNQILLPLHSLPKLQHFHAQLVYCVVQYFEKDSSLAEEFIKKFLKRWPKTASAKEVLFLDELEELIDIIQPAEFSKVQRIIFMQVAKCIRSEQSQVAERALFYWENEYIVSLLEASAPQLFPLLLPSLIDASNLHWNKAVVTMSANVLKNFMTSNQKVFDQVVKTVKQKKIANESKKLEMAQKWTDVEALARNNEHYVLYANKNAGSSGTAFPTR